MEVSRKLSREGRGGAVPETGRRTDVGRRLQQEGRARGALRLKVQRAPGPGRSLIGCGEGEGLGGREAKLGAAVREDCAE